MSHQSDLRTTAVLSQDTEEDSSPTSDQIINEELLPAGPPHGSPSEASHSDSGFSISSNSSGDITGTPFDFGSQRYEYPFPQAQNAPTEPFLPLSSSITIQSPPNSNSPSWPQQVTNTNSFPLTPPPTRKVRTHPKLRSVTAREPPVPPSLVNKRSFWSLSLQRQASAESQQSDLSDPPPRGRKLFPYSIGFNEQDARHASDSDITVRQRKLSPRSASTSRSRKERAASQKTLITGGDRASEVSAAGASASSPGPNGAHRQLDLRPGGAPDRINLRVSSIGELLRTVAGRRG